MAGLQKDWTKENDRLQLIRQFDEKETGKFIREFVSVFKKFLKRKVAHPKDAATDLAHQVVAVYYYKEDLVLSCELMSYSINIAKNLLSNEWQKRFNHPTETQPPEFFNQFAAEDDIFKLVEESEIKLAVHRCINSLSEKCQRILRAYMEGLSAGEAADCMGYPTRKIYQVRKSECMDKFEMEVRRCNELKGLSF